MRGECEGWKSVEWSRGFQLTRNRVLQSSWAVILGVPVAVHGVSYFTIASGCAVVLMQASKVREWEEEW